MTAIVSNAIAILFISPPRSPGKRPHPYLLRLAIMGKAASNSIRMPEMLGVATGAIVEHPPPSPTVAEVSAV
ncbi:MAG: hypothetical protein WC683_12165, partial [bacterium]